MGVPSGNTRLHSVITLLQLPPDSTYWISYELKARSSVWSLHKHPNSNLFMISMLKCILCLSGDAQFVSATYRLFKVPQDSKTDGSRLKYKGIGYILNEKKGKDWKNEIFNSTFIIPAIPLLTCKSPPFLSPWSTPLLSMIPLFTLRLLHDTEMSDLTARQPYEIYLYWLIFVTYYVAR